MKFTKRHLPSNTPSASKQAWPVVFGAMLCLPILAQCSTDELGSSRCALGSDSYLPYEDGYQWDYEITDLENGVVSSKLQFVEEDGEGGYVQVTQKADGETVSRLVYEGKALVRLEQDDVTLGGDIERTTYYEPGQVRLDESPEWLEAGEIAYQYTAKVVSPEGGEQSVDRIDEWTVLGVDVPCESSAGSFRCLHLQKNRTQGGSSVKEYFYARGVGKVKEVNENQIEELVGCTNGR